MNTDPRAWLVLLATEIEDAAPCLFWACPGPDMPVVPMATCRGCSAVQVARAARIATTPVATASVRSGYL